MSREVVRTRKTSANVALDMPDPPQLPKLNVEGSSPFARSTLRLDGAGATVLGAELDAARAPHAEPRS